MAFYFLQDLLAADAFLDAFAPLPAGSFFAPVSPCPPILVATVLSEPKGREIKHFPLTITFRFPSGQQKLTLPTPSPDDQSGPHWTAASEISIDVRLFPLPTLDVGRASELPLTADLWRQIDEDAFGYAQGRRVGNVPYDGFSVWASRDRYDPNVYLAPDMGVVELSLASESAQRWRSLYKKLTLEVLDLLLERFPDELTAHLALALKFEAYRQFLSERDDYVIARDLIKRFERRLRGAYERHKRILPDGSLDTAKAVTPLASVLKAEVAISDADRQDLRRRAEDIAAIFAGTPVESAPLRDASGVAFEREVVTRLLEAGFLTETTATTGDFGIDVVAEKAGLRYAIQCKDYAAPVGVKAVQEAAAGRRVYRCDYACAVSRAGFTRAAQELAIENDVVLMSLEQVERVEELARLLN